MNVRDLYPQSDSSYFSVCSYQPMIDSFGSVLVQVSDHDYQGDTRVLLEDSGLIGLIIFGWGSCSGCDALQACQSFSDLQELYDSLKSRVQWWESAEEALDYFEKHDWEGDYSCHSDETRDFVTQCRNLLAARVAEKHDYSCPSLDGDGKPCTCERNPADCGQREWCYEDGGCMCEASDPAEALGRELQEVNDRLVVERPLLTFVWENVCCDYTPGIVVVTARDVVEAKAMVKEQDEWAWREIRDMVPTVVVTPKVFIVKGGS